MSSKPTLYRIWVRNKKVEHRTYLAGTKDAESVKIKNEILKVFPDEVYPWDFNIWGVSMEGNKYSVHCCSTDPDNKDSGEMQNNVLYDKNFIKYFYDLDTATKKIEIVYKRGQVLPVVTVPSNLRVDYITDHVDAKYVLLNTQAVYVRGKTEDAYTWAQSLKSDIVMPISKTTKVDIDRPSGADDDLFKFQFNASKELVEVLGCFKPEHYCVYGDNQDIYTEYTGDYVNEITNVSDTELVKPQTDNHGNRIAAAVNKANIKEYVLVPKSDGSGGFDKVLLKDL